jgi:hypothetical protein
MQEEAHECRICRLPSTALSPLYCPCLCKVISKEISLFLSLSLSLSFLSLSLTHTICNLLDFLLRHFTGQYEVCTPGLPITGSFVLRDGFCTLAVIPFLNTFAPTLIPKSHSSSNLTPPQLGTLSGLNTRASQRAKSASSCSSSSTSTLRDRVTPLRSGCS